MLFKTHITKNSHWEETKKALIEMVNAAKKMRIAAKNTVLA
ncbi:hypothetical protein ABS764_05510 [Flavobacterium sp. ST-87]|uniref:Uncharacterized protein n=1 Tax=Flavobacterium plantiphilum TaxID=3163297 RepID=A0ABW8XRR2_9FLAO